MNIVDIFTSPWFLVAVIFVGLFFIINTILKALFPDTKSKGLRYIFIGLVIIVIYFIAAYFLSIYALDFFSDESSEGLIQEGAEIGLIDGDGKSYKWCIENANGQFVDRGRDVEFQLVQGWAYGCIVSSDDGAMACEDLPLKPERHDKYLLNKYCGNPIICNLVYFAFQEYCYEN